MQCDIAGCTASEPVSLFLTASGGFVFKPASQLWQIVMSRDANGVMGAHCPLHAIKPMPAPTKTLTRVTDGH